MNMDILRGMVAELKPRLIVHTGCGAGEISNHIATQCLRNKLGYVYCCDGEQNNIDIVQERIDDGKGRFRWEVRLGLGPALLSEVEGADFYILGSKSEFPAQLSSMKPTDNFFLVSDRLEHFDLISKSRFWYGIVKIGGMAIFQK